MARRLAVPFVAIAVLAIVILVYLGNNNHAPSIERQDTMAAPSTATIPPIDAAAPAKTETATFALG